MTDEEIIIDGVNVSECKYFQSSCVPDYSGGYLYKNVCRNHGFYDCDKKPCAFKCIEYQKQLKRKEQEREKYKQALDEIRQYRVCEINDEDEEEGDVILGIIDEVEEQ